ncbi:hypothetical protein A176_006205 [Myxococcus hansupus]|uniref:Uncharacterized protein n=1 Tax=Pseudomyxococcus hansupus TaxID=1297742 RepID=A0A0H4X5W6_9BACT|nr:hypothetical protein [Myxococcus hansupus]AKQ69293.1 hypothetical protein A176_006205 [Myxococcus hansupus]
MPTPSLAFHVLAVTGFGACIPWLLQEAESLGGRRGQVDVAVAVAAGGLLLLSCHALASLWLARPLTALRSRAEVGTYVLVLAGVATLGLLGLHLLTSAEPRPALGGFCLGLATWLSALGFQLVPSLFLGRDGFVDHLGRRTRFTELEWFRLRKQDGELPRTWLQAGRGDTLRLEVRLPHDEAERARGQMVQAGLAPRAQGR